MKMTNQTCGIFCPRALRFSMGTRSIAAPNRTLSAGSKEEEDTNFIKVSPIKRAKGQRSQASRTDRPTSSQPESTNPVANQDLWHYPNTYPTAGKPARGGPGRLRFCLVNCKCLTSDPWIWQVAMRYPLELITEPQQGKPPRLIRFATELNNMISEKIQELEQKSAIQKVAHRPDQFISQMFIVPKKNRSHRPVVNLKLLNHLMAKCKFKMESTRTLKDLVRRNDRMVSIDLKDAYLSVPIEERDRKYLWFIWEESIRVSVSPLWP